MAGIPSTNSLVSMLNCDHFRTGRVGMMNRLRFPDLMSYGFIPATAMAWLLGFAVAALGFLIPAFLAGRGPEQSVLSMMLTAAPGVQVFPMNADIPDHRSWLKQWIPYFSYFTASLKSTMFKSS